MSREMTNSEAIANLNHLIYGIVSPDIQRSLDLAIKALEERPQGEWIITAEDSEGIHRIQCPFCGYEKGSDFIDYITVTFEKLPPFCESCGAELKGGAE